MMLRDKDINRASIKFKDEGYSEGSFVIECFYIHYDGTRFGPVNASFQIRKFDGERDITSLPVVPLQWYEGECEIRERLVERGRKFTQLSNPKERAHRRYKGLTLDKNPEQVCCFSFFFFLFFFSFLLHLKITTSAILFS
jgi:hypothetical protein